LIELLKRLLSKLLIKSSVRDEYLWLISLFFVSTSYLLVIPQFVTTFSSMSGTFLFILDVIVSDKMRSENSENRVYLRTFLFFIIFSFVIDNYVLRMISVLYLINNVSSPFSLRSRNQVITSLVLFITHIFYLFGFAEVLNNEMMGLVFSLMLVFVLAEGCLRRKSHFQSLLITIIYYECLIRNEIVIDPNIMLIPIVLVIIKILQKLEFETMSGNQRLLINRSQLIWLSIATSIYCSNLNIAIVTMVFCLVAKILKEDFLKIVIGIILGIYILFEGVNLAPSFGYSLMTFAIVQLVINYILISQKIEKIRYLQISWKENQITIALLFILMISLIYYTQPSNLRGFGINLLLLFLSILFGALIMFIVQSTKANGKRFIPYLHDIEIPHLDVHIPSMSLSIRSLESLFALINNFIYSLFLDLEKRVNGLHLFIIGSLVVFAIWATRLGM